MERKLHVKQAKPCTDAARCGSETPDRCASDLCVDEALLQILLFEKNKRYR